jgi:hypothetical protein
MGEYRDIPTNNPDLLTIIAVEVCYIHSVLVFTNRHTEEIIIPPPVVIHSEQDAADRSHPSSKLNSKTLMLQVCRF